MTYYPDLGYSERKRGYLTSIVIVLSVFLLWLTMWFILTTISKPAPESLLRCKRMLAGSYTSFPSASGIGRIVAFDTLNKPCLFNAQQEVWEPITPAKP
jgi:hypothetical protein